MDMKDIVLIDELNASKLANYSNITNHEERQTDAARWHQILEGKWHKLAMKAKSLATAVRVADQEEHKMTLPFTEESLEVWTTDAEGRRYNWTNTQENEVVAIWIDGAVTNPTGSDKKGGYAAVIMSETRKMAVETGRYAGPHCHSDMLKAMAIAHAIVCTPKNTAIKIMTDSMTSVV
jgi:hypothetical protein